MSKTHSYISFLEKVEEKLQNDNIELNSHLMVCLEIDENGMPHGQVMKVSGDPYETVGMVDVAIEKLNNLRQNILDKFKKAENVSRKLKNRNSLLEDELRKALEDGNIDALDGLKDALLRGLNDLQKGDDDKKDDDDFDINDFKSQF